MFIIVHVKAAMCTIGTWILLCSDI